ncbi:MAG: hypothetical protein J6Y62_00790 [Clostridia bacterium]|nr:hypothetical protein [Clostridia bacterium]
MKDAKTAALAVKGMARMVADRTYRYDPDHKRKPSTGGPWYQTRYGWTSKKPAEGVRPHADYPKNIMYNKNGKMLDQLARSRNPKVKIDVSKNPYTPSSTLSVLVDNAMKGEPEEARYDEQILKNCARHRGLSKEDAGKIFKSETLARPGTLLGDVYYSGVLADLAANDNFRDILDDEQIETLASFPDPKVRENLFHNLDSASPDDDWANGMLRKMEAYEFENDEGVEDDEYRKKNAGDHYYVNQMVRRALRKRQEWLDWDQAETDRMNARR